MTSNETAIVQLHGRLILNYSRRLFASPQSFFVLHDLLINAYTRRKFLDNDDAQLP